MITRTREGRDVIPRRSFATLLLAITLAGGLVVETVRADRLIGAGNGNIADINPSNGNETFPVFLPGYNCWNPNLPDVVSIERHPVNTEVIYGLLAGTPNALVTIDPVTGVVTIIGDTAGDEFVTELTTITFGPAPDYTLYAMMGADGPSPGSIWTLDPVSGTPTDTGWSTSGDGGHALEFNPDDGMLYHFYSTEGGPNGLEKINPATGVATPQALSGTAYGTVDGIVYAGSNLFYAFDNLTGNILSITTGGVVSVLSTTLDIVVALDFVVPNLLAVDDSGAIFQYDPATAARSNETSLATFGECPAFISSIAKDPATNVYYVITEKDDPLGGDDEFANSLAVVDIDQGTFSNQVNLSSWGVSGITVGPSGQLYGVLDDDPPLGSGKIVTIDEVTGVVTDTGWASDQSGTGHNLEYNPDDGLLYHFYSDGSDEERVETIDPGTGNVTPVGSISLYTFPVIGVVYRGNGLFYVMDSLKFIHTVNTDGEGIATSAGIPAGIYWGLELAPDRVNTAAILAKANLARQIKKLKKVIKKAKKRGQLSKVRRLNKKLKKLKKKYRAL